MPGFIIYQGPSVLDGAPIVCVAIVSSTNVKTGNMLQTYILRADVNPLMAVDTLQDASVCGDCKHRRGLGGACYVNLGQGPRAVFDAFQRGRYAYDPAGARQAAAGRRVRLGTYGDPMAVPHAVWFDLLALADGHTGYSHQWANPGIDETQRMAIMGLCMASADTDAEGDMARSIGMRTFRVRRPGESLARGEFICPASEEAGKRKTCADCLACDGAKRARAASPVIVAHGSLKGRFIRLQPVSAS